MKKINIILKGAPEPNYGYLKLAIRQNQKTRIKSLGIKILKSDWNVNTQRIRKSANPKNLNYSTVEQLNKFLVDKLIQYSNTPFPLSKVKCIGHYMSIVINQTENQGTKQKYQNLFNL